MAEIFSLAFVLLTIPKKQCVGMMNTIIVYEIYCQYFCKWLRSTSLAMMTHDCSWFAMMSTSAVTLLWCHKSVNLLRCHTITVTRLWCLVSHCTVCMALSVSVAQTSYRRRHSHCMTRNNAQRSVEHTYTVTHLHSNTPTQ